MAVGTSQQFTTTVIGSSGKPFWSLLNGVPGAGLGSITQAGLYAAPAQPPVIDYGGAAGAQGVVTVQVSSMYPVAGTLASVDTAETFVITAPAVSAGIFPAAVTVPLGGTVKFQPYAVGSLNRDYTLQVNGVTGGSAATGTIVTDNLNAGLYTAPTILPMTGKNVTIKVISQADTSKSATAVVTLQ